MNKALFSLLLFFSLSTYAQNFETITYIKADTFSLDMDVFMPESTNAGKPLFIYVHGGGFSGGKRNSAHHICDTVRDNGAVAASISYRLMMKGKGFGCNVPLAEKIEAIQVAVNDLRSATRYFIDRYEEYGIDTNKIFVAGGSAGAETVLAAAYWPNNTMNLNNAELSTSFKYAGVISCAGAFMDINLVSKENMIPTMMFHGTCDNLVPYDVAAHHYCPCNSSGWLMFFGSKAIYDKLVKINGIAELYTYRGENHRIAGLPTHTREKEIIDFIFRTAVDKTAYQKHTIYKLEDCSCEKKYYVEY